MEDDKSQDVIDFRGVYDSHDRLWLTAQFWAPHLVFLACFPAAASARGRISYRLLWSRTSSEVCLLRCPSTPCSSSSNTLCPLLLYHHQKSLSLYSMYLKVAFQYSTTDHQQQQQLDEPELTPDQKPKSDQQQMTCSIPCSGSCVASKFYSDRTFSRLLLSTRAGSHLSSVRIIPT